MTCATSGGSSTTTASRWTAWSARAPRRLTDDSLPSAAVEIDTDREISTQTAFGKILDGIARGGGPLADRIVTASPDVTGTTSLGPWVIAHAMARHGAIVTIAGPNQQKAEALAARITEGGGIAHGLPLDARDTGSIREATDAAVTAMGGIDVLVNCVGIQREQSLMEVTEETFDNVYRTNLKSAMFLAQAVARDQIARGEGGRQIHLLSVRSQLALRGRGYSAYCATKGGLLMLVRQHAVELAPHNITVNGVAPTFILSERIRPHLDRPDFRDFIIERNPLGRIGDPLEVAGQVIAVAAPAGSHVTGQVLYVDGGVTASQ